MTNSQSVDVLLLAAGYGKRLLPLTAEIPKPLIQVGRARLIEYNLELLARSGFCRVLINLHYLPEQIRQFVADGSRWGLQVEYSEEPVLLDTGGGIKNIEARMQTGHLLTVNSDTLFASDFTIDNLVSQHLTDSSNPSATMLLRPDVAASSYGSLGVDSSGRVVSFLGHQYWPAEKVQTLMFAGAQVLSRDFISALPEVGTVFSITRDILPELLASGGVVKSVSYDGYWSDVGTIQRLTMARVALGQ